MNDENDIIMLAIFISIQAEQNSDAEDYDNILFMFKLRYNIYDSCYIISWYPYFTQFLYSNKF